MLLEKSGNLKFISLILIFIIGCLIIVSAQNDSDKDLHLKGKVEKHIEKFNDKTADFLKSEIDKQQEKEFLIKFKDNIDETKLTSFSIEKKVNRFKLTTIKGKIKDIDILIDDPDIKFIELDQEIQPLTEEITYNVEKTKAHEIWETTTGQGVNVAILDSGITSHDDLLISGGHSVVSDSYEDSYGHGTAVAGVISALLNNEGIVGVSPDISLYAVKIMEGASGDLSDAIAGVEWALDNNIDIISMSFGIEFYSQIFKEVLQEAYDDGILLVAASGNEGINEILYPAKYSTVIAVGSIDENDNLALTSSYGFEQELVAPGVDIKTTGLNNEYVISSGTSLAAPHVTGVAALIMSYDDSLTNLQIRGKLQNDAFDLGEIGKDDTFGYGLVQVNLDTGGSDPVQESYYYEIFTITNYGSETEEITFWLDGEGTIDDVDFEEGHYLIKKYIEEDVIEEYIYVDEEGNVIVLRIGAPSVDFDNDDYDFDGSDTDGIVWINGYMEFQFINSQADEEVVCVDYDYDGVAFEFWKCWAESSTDLSNCKSKDSNLNTFCNNNPNDCNSSGINDYHEFPIGGSRLDGILKTREYYNCSGAAKIQSLHWGYYTIKYKKTACSGDNYIIRGWADTWIDVETISCGSSKTCDTEIAGSYTSSSETYDFRTGTYHPCRTDDGFACSQTSECLTGHYCVGGICRESDAPVCNGTIEVITEDSDSNPLNNLDVYVDDNYNITIDIYSDNKISIFDVECGTEYNITVKCENDDICGSKIASIDESEEGIDSDSLLFDCNICIGLTDIYVTEDDIRIRKQNTQANVTATIHVENVEGNNLKINYTIINKDGSIGDSKTDTLSSFNKNTNYESSVLLDFTSNSMNVNVYVDPDNDFTQDSKTNNFVSVPAVVLDTKAYLNIDTDYSIVDDEIRDYLGTYVDSVSSGEADVKIYVSVLNSNLNLVGFSGNDWRIDNMARTVIVNDIIGNNPYNGFVASFTQGSDNIIYVIGTGLEGAIAAVKTLVDERNRFLVSSNLGEDDLIYLGELDLEAIQVYDYMHNTENDATSKYGRYSENFRNIVKNSLRKQNYDTSIKLVKTTNADNVTLRIRHLSPQNTPSLRNAIIEDNKPVVLAHGIHSDLTSWEDFGIELAKVGHDPWLIEPYGGPDTDTECSPNCPDYDFSDLKTYYWPALIAGVQAYSGENNLSYVGYDLGCTVGLESLELYPSGQSDIGYYLPSGEWLLTDLSDDPIDTFVGVGCIGNFSRSPSATNSNLPFFAGIIANNSGIYETHPFLFYSCLPFICYNWYDNYNGHLPGGFYKSSNLLIGSVAGAPVQAGYFKIFNIGKNLITKVGWIISLFSVYGSLSDVNYPQLNTGTMSMEVYQDFINWINNPTNVKIGDNVNINNFAIIQSTFNEDRNLTTGEVFYLKGSDGFVSDVDQKGICQNVQSSNKYYIGFDDVPHFSALFRKGVADNPDVKDVIFSFIDEGEIEVAQPYEIISTNQNCD